MAKVSGHEFLVSETLAKGTSVVLSKDINHQHRTVSALLTLDANAQFHVMGLSHAGGEYIASGTLMWTVADAPGEVNVAALHMDLRPGGQLFDAAARVVAGHSVVWDGRNWAPHLTPDAREAFEEMDEFLSLSGYRYLTGREVVDAGDWLYEIAHDTLTGAEDDVALKALGKQWESEAGLEGIVLAGDVLKFLQPIRDKKRGDLVDGDEEMEVSNGT
ncbi:hypothetical protein [Gemmatimonas sp.]|jgi:hypothetical protein|uniref:hypothetical protein n=1 Tax=Gemmatimonas sp. TaxID=1962908 RepID=UPI0037C19B25